MLHFNARQSAALCCKTQHCSISPHQAKNRSSMVAAKLYESKDLRFFEKNIWRKICHWHGVRHKTSSPSPVSAGDGKLARGASDEN
jgi:hypothetical protein